MKYVLLLLLLTPALFATKWNYNNILSKGYKVEIICKHNVLVEKIISPDNTNFVEQPVCYNYSSWTEACVHPPIQCVNKE
jgi:hypothetical protein